MKNRLYGIRAIAVIFIVFSLVAFVAIKIEKAINPYQPPIIEA